MKTLLHPLTFFLSNSFKFIKKIKSITLFYNVICIVFLIYTCSPYAVAQAPGIQWQKPYGGSNYDEANVMIQTSDGGFIFGGRSNSSDGDISGVHMGSYDAWVAKVDANGDLEWENLHGSAQIQNLRDIKQTLDGGYVLACRYDDFYWIIKLDENGNNEWSHLYGGSETELISSIELSADSGYVIAGSSTSNDLDVSGNYGGKDFWVLKIDKDGDIVWQNSYGGSGDDHPYSIASTLDGGYVVAGYTGSDNGLVNGYHGGGDAWMIKIDEFGVFQWQKCYGGTQNDVINDAIQLEDGTFLFTGRSSSNDEDVTGHHGGTDTWVVHADVDGTILWSKMYGGSHDDLGNSVVQIPNGGYIIAGQTFSQDGDLSFDMGVNPNSGSGAAWLIKIDPLGSIIWEGVFGGTGNESAQSIVQTVDGGYAFLGWTSSNDLHVSGNHGSFDFWLVKLASDALVWPGDADNNGTANVFDIFPIGIGYGSFGSFRDNASSAWQGQYASEWSQYFNSGNNYKFADCTGNGSINSLDIAPIIANYGLVHYKTGGEQDTILDNPFLSFQPVNDTVGLSSVVNVPIHLGNTDMPVENIYGIAFTITYDPSLIDTSSIEVSFENSWLGVEGTDLISVQKDFSVEGEIHVGIVRTNQSNVSSGFGEIATLDIIIADDLQGKTNDLYASLPLGFTNVKAISFNEDEVLVDVLGSNLVVVEESPLKNKTFNVQTSFSIFPNPANDQVFINASEDLLGTQVLLRNTSGQVVQQVNIQDKQTIISLRDLVNGAYIMEVNTSSSLLQKKLFVIH